MFLFKKQKNNPDNLVTPQADSNLASPEPITAVGKKNSIKKRARLSGPKAAVFVAIFGLIGGIVIWKSLAAPVVPVTAPQASDAVSDQLLISFKPGATKSQRDKVLNDNKLDVINEIPQIGVKVVRVAPQARDSVERALSHNPAVEFAETDQMRKPQEQLPNDPFFLNSGSWNLGGGNWSAYRINAPQAWDITQGNSAVNIAVIDTGIKPAGLTDYSGQIGATWNVMNSTTDATTNAGNHGTYVAGAAAAAINNDVGNNGICPKCKLMIVQAGTDSGAADSNLASGITWAADHGAKVENLSWAGPGTSSTIANAVNYARSKGVVIFAAAGNSNCDCATYPSDSPGVFGVAGTSDAAGTTKAGDSNYGSWVAIAAPEGYITGWPAMNGSPGYAPVGGTSLASPVAAGLAGLLFSYNQSLTGAQVEQAIQSTATPTSFATKYGQINALAALQSLGASDPQPSSGPVQTAAPHLFLSTNGDLYHITGFSGTPQVGQRLIRGVGGWTGSSGLSVVSGQWQRCDSSGNACANLTAVGDYTIQSADVGNTIKLSFIVKNSVGSVPQTILTPVVGGSVSPAPTASISVSPASITAGQSSTVTWSSSNSTACTASGAWSGSQATSGSLVVTPPTNSSYNITCTGAGGSATATTTILVSPLVSPPATPTGLSPTPLDKAVTLTWNPNSETDLANYDLQYKPSSSGTWTTISSITGITYTVSSLTNAASYDFQIRAKNTSSQTSAWSASVSATPQSNQPVDTTAPTAAISSPANGSSIAGKKKVSILASASDNNVVIKIELYIDGQLKTTVTTTSLNYTWTINKTVKTGTHTILVKAYDAAGNIGQATVTVSK